MSNIIEEAPRNTSFCGKLRGFFTSTNLERQLETVGLVIFNYFIILMANPEIACRDAAKESRARGFFGGGFLFPLTFNRFGFTYSWMSLLLHTLALLPVVLPRSQWRIYLAPILLWNVCSFMAFIDNCNDILTAMYDPDVWAVSLVAVFVTWQVVAFSWATLICFKLLKPVT